MFSQSHRRCRRGALSPIYECSTSYIRASSYRLRTRTLDPGWLSRSPESRGGGGERSAARRSRVRPPRVHLLLGDSVAHRAPLATRLREDDILRRARGGETWGSLLGHLEADLAFWRFYTESRRGELGNVLVWLTGNDIYSPLTGLPSCDKNKLDDVGKTATQVTTALMQAGRPISAHHQY